MPCDQEILKEGWVLKNQCFWTAALKKTLESPLDCKIKPVHPKGNQSWIFIGRTDAEAEAPILWPPDAKSWLIGKDPDAGKDWRREGKGTTEDEMVGWHHWLTGHEFEQALGDGEGQGSLVCPWGRKESDMTERLNKTNKQKNVHRGASEDQNKSVHSSTIHDSPNKELLQCPSTVGWINKLWLIHAME